MCMSYVDLNPMRAGIAQSLEESDFTSIQQRLAEYARGLAAYSATATGSTAEAAGVRPQLVRLFEVGAAQAGEALPVDFDSYVELLVATGAALYSREPIPPEVPAPARRTLERSGIHSERWLEAVRSYPKRFFAMIGCVHRIEIYCARTDRDRAKGSRWAAQVFRNCA